MSLDITLTTRNRYAAGKLETTTGTAIALGAPECSLFNWIGSPKISGKVGKNKRKAQGVQANLITIPGQRGGACSWQSEIFGSGTAATAPPWAALLQACGCSLSTNVFTPVSPTATQALNSATVGFFQSGRFKSLAGAMGNLKLSGKVGSPLRLTWEWQGVWQAVQRIAIPTGITPPTSPKPPTFAGGTFAVGGQTMRVSQFEFDAGAQIYIREDPTSVDGSVGTLGTGLRAAIIMDREPTIKINPESEPLNVLDFFGAFDAMTTYSFSLQVGATAGNQFTFAAPAAQLQDPPEDEDRSGMMADDLTFLCTGTADAEWSFTFG
jgi:hypothetical protein